MGQLFSTFGINWQLLLIQGINFGVLLVALWYFLYRPVMRIIDARKAKIREGVEAAEAAHRELEQTRTDRDAVLTKASEESEEMIARARERAVEKADEMVADAESRAAALLADAEARAEAAKVAAMKASEAGIAKAAVLAAEKVLRERAATR